MTEKQYIRLIVDAIRSSIADSLDKQEITVSVNEISLILNYIGDTIATEEEAAIVNTTLLEACVECGFPIFQPKDKQHIFLKGNIYPMCDRCWSDQRNKNLEEYHQLKHYRRFVKDNDLEEMFEKYMQN